MAGTLVSYRVLEPVWLPSELSSQIVDPMHDGTLCFVASVGSLYYLMKQSGAAPAPPAVLSAASSSLPNARWVQIPGGGSTAGALLADGSVAVDSYLDFTPVDGSTVPHQRGRIFYDTMEDAFTAMTTDSDFRHQLGWEVCVRALNWSGVDIPDAKVVYQSGVQGNRPLVDLASAADESTCRLLGITTTPVVNHDPVGGVVTLLGRLSTNTSGYTAGLPLYASDSVGLMSNFPGTCTRRIGTALNSTPNGHVLVQVGSGTDPHPICVPLLSGLATDTTGTWTTIGTASFSPGYYGIYTVIFQAILHTGNASHEARARLWNLSTASQMGSTLVSTSLTPTLEQVSFTPPAGVGLYALQIQTQTAGQTATCSMGRLFRR